MPVKSLALSKTEPKAGIFLNQSTAKKLIVDLKFCTQKLPVATKELAICDASVANLTEQKANLSLEIDGLKKDSIAAMKVEKEYKDKYVKASDDLRECRSDQPSRLTWFGAGVISALVLGIAAALAIK